MIHALGPLLLLLAYCKLDRLLISVTFARLFYLWTKLDTYPYFGVVQFESALLANIRLGWMLNTN